jgi:O-antigen ligase
MLALALAYSPLVPRTENYIRALTSGSGTPEAASLHQREAMWQAAYSAILNSPWTGYGIKNRFAAIVPYLPPEFRGKLHYSHTHNGFLTAAVAGGIPAMLATILLIVSPFYLACRHIGGIWREDMIALTLGAALVYCTAGTVGIMFFHDATDAIFCWVMVIAAIFVRGEDTGEFHASG